VLTISAMAAPMRLDCFAKLLRRLLTGAEFHA
jgi:hypothetical protein